MAVGGSRDYFQYLDDQGRSWNIQLDVSDQATLGGTRGALQANTNDGRVLTQRGHKSLRPRYVLLRSTVEPARNIKKVVTDPTLGIWDGSQNSYTQDGELFIVTARVGEVRFNPPTADTGIVEAAG